MRFPMSWAETVTLDQKGLEKAETENKADWSFQLLSW
jgi:hypothetical protein